MKKIYKFGYITGWFVLLLILFFIFSMFISITRLRLIDIIFCVIVIILGLKYYIKYTLFYYSFYVKDEVLFIYQKHKLCYQISLASIKIEQGAFKHEQKLTFAINNCLHEYTIDYDNELCQSANTKNYRKWWYIVYMLSTLLLVAATIYAIINK